VTSIAVVGAGAIGGLLTAELIAAGRSVTLCARSPLDRLVVERDERPLDVPVRAVTAPSQLGGADWLFVALKGPDTAAAAPWIEAAAPETVVVVQNGVEHDAHFAHAIVPALVYTAVRRVAPGRLVHSAGNRLIAPPHDGLAELFEGTTLDVALEADFRTEAWRKLLSNITGNPLTTLTLGRAATLRRPALRELALGLLREGVAVGRAEGARFAGDEAERMLGFLDALPPDAGSSMLWDRLAGRPLEYDLLTGAVVRAAQRHGLEVPLNRAILALLEGLDASRTAESV
jgi:2-dehydropantoate 2-reductase